MPNQFIDYVCMYVSANPKVYERTMYVYTTFRQSRSRSLSFSTSSVLSGWKMLVTGMLVQRSLMLDCCYGPEEVYTE